MFSSLKSQLIFALTIIIVLFVGQEYVSYQSQSLLVTGLTTNHKLAKGVVQVKNLEKDVLDLQRNVLIYKESNSKSALKRFDDILLNVSEKLNIAQAFITEHKIKTANENTIASMQGHIADYQENFNSVVILIDKKHQIFNQQLIVKLERVKDYITHIHSTMDHSAPQHDDIEKLNILLASLQVNAYQYFLKPSAENINNFQKHYQEIQQLGIIQTSAELAQKLQALNANFALLTQVVRNYNYLVNVVMSGSANEFLYLAKNLSETVLTHLENNNDALNTSVASSVFRGNIMFTLGISITALITFIVVTRIIIPIQRVTRVFDALSSNKNIEQLAVTRKDEVGKLLHAANAFHVKNQQTNELLIQEKQLNDALAISKRKAEHATKSKSTFLANMSHEIRTPMNGIIGLLDLLSMKPLGAEEREYVDKIRYSSNILMSVINDILDFSKIEAGKIDIENVEFDPMLTIENVIEAINVKAAEKNLNVFCSFPADMPPLLIGDPVRLNQILLNLGNNAVKFTERGHINFIIRQSITSENIELSIDVVDTGIGISEAQQRDIFKDFTQAEASTTRKYGGTGLGLSISQQLTKLMGGSISVESTIEKGSKFTVKVPFTIAEPYKQNQQPSWHNSSILICSVGDISEQIEENLAPYVKHITSLNLSLTQSDTIPLNDYDAVIINLATKLTIEQVSALKHLQSKQANVGFCCKAHAISAKTSINMFSDIPLLEHPLLPSKIISYLDKLLSGSAKVETVTENTVTDQPVPQFSGHVLLVEDNAINQMVAGKVLNSFGLTYDLAEDGQQAYTKVINSPDYDLIFMDIQMPVMDGYETTEKIRQSGLVDLIICGLSANAMKTDIEKGMAAGMNEYITKPIEREDIHRILVKYLTHADYQI